MKINIINKIKPHVNKNVWNYLKAKKLCVKYCEEFLRDNLISEIYEIDNYTILNSFAWRFSKDGFTFWQNVYNDYKIYINHQKT